PAGPHGAGGGGEHREELGRGLGGDQHGLVSGRGGLRGEDVHGLRTRCSRQQLQGEGGDVVVAQSLHQRMFAERRQGTDEHGAAAHRGHQIGRWRLYREDDVGSGIYFARAGGGSHAVGAVGETGREARTLLDQKLHAGRAELLRHFRHHGDTPFATCRLPDDADTYCHTWPSPLARPMVAPDLPAGAKRGPDHGPPEAAASVRQAGSATLPAWTFSHLTCCASAPRCPAVISPNRRPLPPSCAPCSRWRCMCLTTAGWPPGASSSCARRAAAVSARCCRTLSAASIRTQAKPHWKRKPRASHTRPWWWSWSPA